MGRRQRAFTLIELLVVIAIIGILAAMVFPVFARARESARKAVCLSNVKNIALAVNMYLADNNDMLPPMEHREEVRQFMGTQPGGNAYWEYPCQHNCDQANPYLRFPVMMDEYVKNRDVWRCPSAKLETGPRLVLSNPDWFAEIVANVGEFGKGTNLCIKDNVFPNGWGGDVTDSFLQDRTPGALALDRAWEGDTMANKVFLQSIGLNGAGTRELKLAAVGDAVNYAICGDLGPWNEMMSIGLLAYPDLCAVECSNCWCTDSWIEDCIDNITEGCPETADCFYATHSNSSMLKDQTQLVRGTRHLGGTNIGFLDGHASWMQSARLLDKWAEEAREKGATAWPSAMGLDAWGPYSWWACDDGLFVEVSGGEPTLR